MAADASACFTPRFLLCTSVACPTYEVATVAASVDLVAADNLLYTKFDKLMFALQSPHGLDYTQRVCVCVCAEIRRKGG